MIKLMIHFEKDEIPYHVDLPVPILDSIDKGHPDANYRVRAFLKTKFPTYQIVGEGPEEFDAFPKAG